MIYLVCFLFLLNLTLVLTFGCMVVKFFKSIAAFEQELNKTTMELFKKE